MKLMRSFLRLTACLSLIVFAATASAQLTAGRDYRLINPPQPVDSGKRVEVIEFFWYGCPHCNALQGPLRVWLKRKPADVEFRRVPAVFDDSWLPLTYAYYALEAMGLTEKLHYDLFAALHEQKLRLSNPEALFDWVARHGVDRQQFASTFRSFGVKSRAQRSIEMTRNYDIPGTPALTVDGKYLVSPSLTLRPDRTVDYERFFETLDSVIAMARRERAAAK